jgi:hypothetical protein
MAEQTVLKQMRASNTSSRRGFRRLAEDLASADEEPEDGYPDCIEQ